MNVFNSLPIYAGKWEVKETRDFTDEEKAAVSQATIIPSWHGNSVQFTMKSGGITFMTLDRNSQFGTGDLVDLSKAKLITLSKPGEADIYLLL